MEGETKITTVEKVKDPKRVAHGKKARCHFSGSKSTKSKGTTGTTTSRIPNLILFTTRSHDLYRRCRIRWVSLLEKRRTH